METQSINKIIIEIRAGTGGDEASLFAGDLARMYQKYAAKRGSRFTILDASESGARGYKTLIAEVAGTGVYDALKNESGVHRVQRVPATERQGRIHTSTASVAVLPVGQKHHNCRNPCAGCDLGQQGFAWLVERGIDVGGRRVAAVHSRRLNAEPQACASKVPGNDLDRLSVGWLLGPLPTPLGVTRS